MEGGHLCIYETWSGPIFPLGRDFRRACVEIVYIPAEVVVVGGVPSLGDNEPFDLQRPKGMELSSCQQG